MTYYFTPPTVVERPDTGNRLVDAWVKIARGVTVLKAADGSYSTTMYPSQDDLAAASVYYLGGHTYPVSDVEAGHLSAAGFSDLLSDQLRQYDHAIFGLSTYA